MLRVCFKWISSSCILFAGLFFSSAGTGRCPSLKRRYDSRRFKLARRVRREKHRKEAEEAENAKAEKAKVSGRQSTQADGAENGEGDGEDEEMVGPQVAMPAVNANGPVEGCENGEATGAG